MTHFLLLIPVVALLGGCYLQKAPGRSPAPPGLGPTSLIEPLILSTNEPFFQVQVEKKALYLTAIDMTEQMAFTITDIRNVPDGRRWTGRNNGEDIVVQVRDTPCVDSMSGASFPYSGTLIVGQITAKGCARPASMPPPGAGM